MFLPPRVRSTRQKSRHAQRSATLNALPLRPLPAKPFSFAATKISIGRGPRCRYGHCRRNRSPLPQRKLVSDAEPRCRYGHCRRAIPHCSSEDATSIPKSGLEIKNRCTQDGVNRQNHASIPKSGLKIKNRCTPEDVNRQKLASIRKSGPEIKNRCTPEGVNRQNPASIRKSGLEIKNRCMQQAIFSTRSLNESLWR